MVPPSPARVYLEQEMERAELLELAGGSVAVFSTRSPARESANEDAAAVIPCAPDAGILVVADGAGGQRGGAQAAQVAIRSLQEALTVELTAEHALRAAVIDGIERANRSVSELGTGAATTLAVVKIEAGTARPFHVGDSAILVVGQRGRVKHQSVAHGPVGYAVEAGLINESQAMRHEERHLVSNFVGSPEMRIEIGPSLQLAARDTVLLASDGLSDNLFVNEIVERIRKGSLAGAASALASLTRHRMLRENENERPSKPDDLTFVLYRPAAPVRADRQAPALNRTPTASPG